MKKNDMSEVFLHKHICLAEDHFNPLGIIRSLGEKGIKPIVLLCCKNSKLVRYSKYIEEKYYFDSIQEAFNFMIDNYSNEEKVPFVYNGSDNLALLLDDNFEYLRDKFYFCNAQGNLKSFLNKDEGCMLAEECGCLIPKQVLAIKGELPKSLRYPIITKAKTSANGGDWKAETFICNSEEELLYAYEHIESSSILIQEFIEKDNELCIDGISINQGDDVLLTYAANYHRFTKESYGGYFYYKILKDDALKEKIKKIMQKSKYSGIFCIEFLIDKKGDYYFLEVNFRNSGWSYAYTYAGVNLPFIWATSTLENKISFNDNLVEKTFDVMSELDDYGFAVKSGQISVLKWLYDFFDTDCHLIFNYKDQRPFWMYIFVSVKNRIKKLFKR